MQVSRGENNMQLIPEKSLCEKNPASVVSKDKGESRKHCAINPNRKFDLRHYQLDGVLIQQETCCDFLLINDSTKKAYLIELKGKDIKKAVKQLQAGEKHCKSALGGYTFFYRIICSKAKTHQIEDSTVRKFKDKHGMRFKIKETYLSENLN